MNQETLTAQDGRLITILRPEGRLDITTAWQFRLKLQDCMNTNGPYIVVNLEHVSFIDSSGLTSLVAGMRDADKVNGSFSICSVHPEAKLVFEVTMMDSVFEIFESEEDALQASQVSTQDDSQSSSSPRKGEFLGKRTSKRENNIGP